MEIILINFFIYLNWIWMNDNIHFHFKTSVAKQDITCIGMVCLQNRKEWQLFIWTKNFVLH